MDVKGFLYYIPNGKLVQTKDLEGMGLQHLDGLPIECGEVGNGAGIGNTNGVIFSCADGIRVGYYPDKQVWKKTSAGYWIGYYTEGKPGPADLLRASDIPTVDVLLGDENYWGFTPEAGLPKSLGLGDDGHLAQFPLSKYDAVYEACAWLSAFYKGEYGEMAPFEEVIPHLVTCLGVNYRIGYFEALALNLFRTDNAQAVAHVALGYIFDDVDDKKKEADTEPSD